MGDTELSGPEGAERGRDAADGGKSDGAFCEVAFGAVHGAKLPGAYGFDEHKSVASNDSRFEEMAPGFRPKPAVWIVDNALEFIRNGDKEKPFYVQCWMLLPHAPLSPTEAQLETFKNMQPGPGVPWPGARQIYNVALRNLDTEVGRLLGELEKDGLAACACREFCVCGDGLRQAGRTRSRQCRQWTCCRHWLSWLESRYRWQLTAKLSLTFWAGSRVRRVRRYFGSGALLWRRW